MGGLIRGCYFERILPCGAKLIELVQADLTQGVYVLLSLFALGGDGVGIYLIRHFFHSLDLCELCFFYFDFAMLRILS